MAVTGQPPTPVHARRGRRPEPLLRDLLGAVLRDVRTARGLTLRELAERSQVSTPYLSEVERGRKEPSSEVLAAVARALGLRLEDLLGLAWRTLADERAAGAPGAVGQGAAGAGAAGGAVVGGARNRGTVLLAA